MNALLLLVLGVALVSADRYSSSYNNLDALFGSQGGASGQIFGQGGQGGQDYGNQRPQYPQVIKPPTDNKDFFYTAVVTLGPTSDAKSKSTVALNTAILIALSKKFGLPGITIFNAVAQKGQQGIYEYAVKKQYQSQGQSYPGQGYYPFFYQRGQFQQGPQYQQQFQGQQYQQYFQGQQFQREGQQEQQQFEKNQEFELTADALADVEKKYGMRPTYYKPKAVGFSNQVSLIVTFVDNEQGKYYNAFKAFLQDFKKRTGAYVLATAERATAINLDYYE